MFVHYEEAGYLDDQFLHGLLHYVCYVIMNVCMYVYNLKTSIQIYCRSLDKVCYDGHLMLWFVCVHYVHTSTQHYCM